MSTTRYDWWPYVKGMIRRYPELCSQEADLHTTAVTPNYSGTPGGHGGHTDPVANAALRTLPEVNRRELEAVRAAIRTTESLPSGRERMSLVKLYYWQRSHTIFGAANAIHISEKTALRWNRELIMQVAKNFGLLEE